MTDLRYPVGRFAYDEQITDGKRTAWIRQIAETPAALRSAVDGLSAAQLDTPYRPEGWTVRQVVHHVPDSHLHSYLRFKFALTEDNPTIKPYDESTWARLPDASSANSIEQSLQLLDSLHFRFVEMWRGLDAAQWARPYQHPDRGPMTLDRTLALYAWHGPHHIAHISGLRERMGW